MGAAEYEELRVQSLTQLRSEAVWKDETMLVSECGRFKAEIDRRPTGSFRITLYKWVEDWVPGYGKEEFWMCVPGHVILTDTLENAERLARDEIRALAEQDRLGNPK